MRVSEQTLQAVAGMVEQMVSHNGTRMGVLRALSQSEGLSKIGGATTLDNPTASGRSAINALNIALTEAGLHFKISVFKLTGALRWRYTIEPISPSVRLNIPRKRRRVA